MRQLGLNLKEEPSRGGKRAGAGRKRVGPLRCVPHAERPFHDKAHPVHLTWRAVDSVASLRRGRVAERIEGAIARASNDRFRVIHYSIQPDHLHLIVEAKDRDTLSRGARGLGIRIAYAVQRALGRTGRVLADRYHARPLGSPLEVRRALVYVLLNWIKHVPCSRGVDRLSSGVHFGGWKQRVDLRVGPAPVGAPTTWLAHTGWWKRHGLLSIYEHPHGAVPWQT